MIGLRKAGERQEITQLAAFDTLISDALKPINGYFKIVFGFRAMQKTIKTLLGHTHIFECHHIEQIGLRFQNRLYMTQFHIY